jgi:AraC family transcriptional regulator
MSLAPFRLQSEGYSGCDREARRGDKGDEGMLAPRLVVEAGLDSRLGRFELRRYEWSTPNDDVLKAPDDHVLDLSLTPRPKFARGRYLESWNPARFEPIGDIFFVPAGHSMHGRSDGGRQSSVMCLLHAGPMREWLEENVIWTERRLAATFDISSRALRALLIRLAEEARAPGFATEVLVEMISGQLAIDLARYFQTVSEAPIGGLAPWQLRAINARLTDMPEAPTLQELAALCRLSTRHLSRAFRASKGLSIGAYVAQARVGHAKRQLVDGRAIKEVAYALGFASPSSFAQAFRKATGQSPRAFRSHP